jgi:N12 class adenine-specific DNA methylase
MDRHGNETRMDFRTPQNIMDNEFFRQKGAGQVSTGQEQEAIDANPSEQSGTNVRMGAPVWKQFVVNKAFQEANQAGIQAERDQMRMAEAGNRRASRPGYGVPMFKGGGGKLIRVLGGRGEELDPEEWTNDPEAGPIARKSLWDREIKTAKREASDSAFRLKDPAFHAKSLKDKDREDFLAEGDGLAETDPRHIELKAKLKADDEYRAEKDRLAKHSYDREAYARQLEETDPETWFQNRSQPTAADSRAALVAETQAKRSEVTAADNSAADEGRQIRAEFAQGVKGPEVAAKQARLAEIAAARGTIAQEAVKAEEPIKAVQGEAEKEKAYWEKSGAPNADGKTPPKDFFDLGDTVSGIWDAVKGLGTSAPAAFYQLVEGMERPDKYSESAKKAFAEADAFNKEMQAKTEANQKAGTSSSVGESFREAGGSLGFSLGSMAASLPASYVGMKGGAATGAGIAAIAGVAGPQAAVPEELVTVPVGAAIGGTIGGVAAGMAASGTAAYRMAGASFLNESFQSLEAESMKKSGRPMNEEEKASAYAALLPIAQNSALWEAGPEAVGNAVTMGAGKIIFGLGKGIQNAFLKNLAKTAGGKVAVKVGAGAGSLATELTGETLTNVEQSADQQKATAIAQGQDPNAIKADWSAGGVVESFKEVAPQTLALMGLMGGAGGALKLASKATGIGGKNPDGTPATPEDFKPQIDTALAAIDPEIAPADPAEIERAVLLGGRGHGPAEVAQAVLIERELVDVEAQEAAEIAAADAAIVAAVDPKERKAAEGNREILETGRAATVRAVVKIAAGQNPHDLTVAELASLGMVREGDEVFPMDDKEREKAGISEPMADVGPDGSVILTDAAIKRVKAASPTAGARIAMPEATARQKAQQRADQISADSQNGGPGDPVTGSSPGGEGVPIETNAAAETSPTEFDVPMRDGTVLRVKAPDADTALQEAAAVAAITGQPATPVQPTFTNDNQQPAESSQLQVPVSGVPRNDAGTAIPGNDDAGITGNPTGSNPAVPPTAAAEAVAATGAQQPSKAAIATAKAKLAKIKKKSPKIAAVLNVTNDPAARAEAKPDGSITINPERVITEAMRGGMNDTQAADYFDRVLDEEIRHAAQYAAAAMLWKHSGSKLDLATWRESHYAGIWKSDFSGKKGDAARDLYTRTDAGNLAAWDAMSDGDKALEAIRIMSQDQVTEEAIFLWTSISDTLRTALKAALQSLKSLAQAASPTLQQEITNLENALRSLTESQPRRGSPKADPAQPAQGGETAGNAPPAPQAGAGEAANDGGTVPPRSEGAGAPLAVGARVEFEINGRTVTGVVRDVRDGVPVASVRLDSNPDVPVRVPKKNLRVVESETKPQAAPAIEATAGDVVEMNAEFDAETKRLDAERAKAVAETPAAEMSPKEWSDSSKARQDAVYRERIKRVEMELRAYSPDSYEIPRLREELKSLQSRLIQNQNWKTEDLTGNHPSKVEEAIKDGKPVSVASVEAYGIALPTGYSKQGDLYVFEPAAKPADLDKFVTAYSNYHLARVAREAKSGKQSPEYYDQQRAAWTPDNVRDRVIEFLKVIDTKDVATLDGYNNGQFDGFWKLFGMRTGMSPMPKTQTGIADVIRSYVGDEAWNANEKANEAARAKRAEERAAKDEKYRIEGLQFGAERLKVRHEGKDMNGRELADQLLAEGWRVVDVSESPIPRYQFLKEGQSIKNSKGFGEIYAYAREAQKGMPDFVSEEQQREEAEFNALPQEEQEAMNSLFAPGGTKPIPAKLTLTPDEQALEAFLEDIGGGLETSPLTPSEFYRSKGIPKDKRAAFLDVADQLYEAGVRSPADLAAKLSKIGGGKFKQYSHALWGGMVSSYPDLPNAEDWAGVYGELDKANQKDEGSTDDNAPQSEADSQSPQAGDAVERGASEPVASELRGETTDSKPAEQLPENGGRAGGSGDTGTVGGNAPRSSVGSGDSEQAGGDGTQRGGKRSPQGADSVGTGDGSGVAGGEQPAGITGYRLTDPESIIGAGGPKARFARNKLALETYDTVLSENRKPTAEEQDALASYIGWGSFGQELFQGSWERPNPQPAFAKESEWLRDHLGQAGWESIRDSIINAHYTDPPHIQALWRIVEHLGFKGGRVLEPSMGIGSFFGLMPDVIRSKSSLTGIELDRVVGGMAQMLYPDANIRIMGYEKSATADGFYDLVIGNWPFAKEGPSDPRYNSLGLSLHDYFFVKALDQTRPGGLVIGITSSGTMDKKGQTARRQMARRAELVAAFRFPTGAFEKYAGTKVVTDVVILKKRETPASAVEEDGWMNTEQNGKGNETFNANEYWRKHPENVLGEMKYGHGTTQGRAGMIVERKDDYQDKLARIEQSLPKDILTKSDKPEKVTFQNREDTADQNSVTWSEKDGAMPAGFYIVRGEQLQPLEDLFTWTLKEEKKTEKRRDELKQLLGLREDIKDLLRGQREGDPQTETIRARAKVKYDAFVKAHGAIGNSFMLKALDKAGDPMALTLKNLERAEGGKFVPRDILLKDIMRRPVADAKGDIGDAYAIQRNQSTTLDVEAIAKLADKPVDNVIARLVELDQIYKTPTGTWEPSEEYLGGNVRRKLREARDAKEQGIDMDRNIEALEKVQPKDVAYFEIEVQMGASWIPREDYLNFASHLLSSEAETAGKDFELTRAISGWNFKINNESLKRGTGATATWGTQSISFAKIFQAAMNGTTVKIYDTDRDGVRTLNTEETDLANKKIDDIREELANWLWSDPGRAGRIANDYNEVMNSEVVPKRNGSHLRFEGLALTMGTTEFDFRQHQKDAVWRGIMDGQMLAAHEVGTGKTFTMAGLAVEGRRLGKFRKSLVFAHNANAESVYKDFQAAYPGGKFLFIDSLSPTNRENAMRQIANDEWDAIVVTHSLIDRFALREETLMEIAQKQIRQLESEIADALQDLGVSGALNIDSEEDVSKALKFVKDSHTAKELVKTRNRIIKRIKDKAAKAMNDNAVFFEDLGVDAIMVDEAHMFKKIALATRKEVKGLNKTESDRGWMLGALTDTVKARNNGKGVFLFTGTPLTNNLNEAYNMMRFVMDDAMESAGLNGFDDWFNSFAQAVSDVELTTGGTYEPVTRLLSFINVPELARLAGRYFDVVQAKSMPEFIPRASTEGKTPGGLGRPFKVMRPVTAEMTPEQKEHKRSIQARYKAFQALSGKDKRKAMLNGVDTPIQLESEGIKAALDMRLIDPTLPDSPDSKANLMVRNAISHYQEDPKATQMIFMERGWNDFTDAQVSMKDENGVTIKDFDGKKVTSKQRRPQFNLVRDMVEKLVAQGVRPDEIAVFSNMTLDPVKDRPGDVLRKVNRVSGSVSKEDLAALMREGKIRFAFGSTQTMGTGVNAQDNMRAMHHLDAPWTPGEFEQRNGRGHRQGNQWNTVYEYRYFTEGSHDGRRWQVLLNKVKFISRFTEMLVDAGGSSLRVLTGDGADLNEGGSDVADFESSFSTAAGDPRILVRAKLKGDVEKLERRRDTHYQSIERAKGDIKRLKQSKTYSNGRIKSITSALERWNKAKEGPFSIKIGEKTYTDRKEVEAYLAAFPSLTQKDNGKLIVEYNGAKIFHRWQTWEGGKSTFQMELPTDNDVIVLNPSLSLGSIEATVRGQTRVLNNIQEEFDSIDGSVASLEEMIQKPFTREAELETKQAALQQIQVELDRAPQPAPSWLRNGAPVGSLVYLEDGKAYDVAAHRWDENGWWVLVENESGMQPVDYRKVMDETGHPMFEEVEFTAPDRNDSEEDEDSNVIPGITITESDLKRIFKEADESIREKGILGATSKTARNVNNAAMDGWLFNQASYRKTDGRLTTLRRLEAKLEQKSEDGNRPNEPLLEKVRSEIKGIELQKMSDAKMQVSTALQAASIPAADSSGQVDFEAADSPGNVFGNYQLADPDSLNSWEKSALRNAEKAAGRGKVSAARLTLQKGQAPKPAAQFAAALFRVFHKRILFVAAKGAEDLNFEGMVHPSDLNTIIIDADSPQGFSYLIGHELGHSIQHQQPELYDKFKAAILAMAPDWADYNDRLAKVKDYDTQDKRDAEFVNDFIGSQFGDPKFWRKLQERDAGVFRKVLDSALEFLASIGGKISVIHRDVRPYFQDIEAARNELANTLGQYRKGKMPDVSIRKDLKDSEGLRTATIPAAQQSIRHAELEAKHNAGTITPEETAYAKMLVETRARQTEGIVEAVHGGVEGITSFDAEKIKTQDGGAGFYFSTDIYAGHAENYAKKSGGKVYRVFLNLRKPYYSPTPYTSTPSNDENVWKPTLESIRNLYGLTSREVAIFVDHFQGLTLNLLANPHEFAYRLSTLEKRGTFKEFSPKVQSGITTMRKTLQGEYGAQNKLDLIRFLTKHDGIVYKDGSVATVLNPSQIKSAEPFTGVPLSERFNPASDSILRTSTIPAAQNLDSLKQRGRVAFAKARPLIEEAEGTIKDFGAGSLGVNPKFANFGGANQDARNQVDIVRAYDTFARETRADRDTFAKAKELLAKDPAGVEELALGAFGEGKPAISDHEQLAIEMFIQQRLAGSGDSRQAQVDNFVLIQANILNRRETARTLRIGFDKFMTPEERAHQQLADAIFRVHPKVEARAKTMTLAERKAFLAEAGSARIAEVERELKKLGLRISQVIGKNRALQLENSRMMKEVLKTRDLMDQKIIQAVQKGATIADIKRTLGKDAAAKAQEVATKARAELFEKIKSMAASGMSRDQIREALKDSLKSSPLGAASNGMTDADIWSMIEQDFGIAETIPERALPSAKPKKAKQEKLESTNPLSSNWARPEFTDGMNAYQFDTKDRAGIMERVEIIRGLAGAVGKIDSLQGDKRTQAEAKLKEINAILKKYGTDAAGIFGASQGIESYGFDMTDIAQVAAVARAINAIDADVVDKASEYLYASMLSGLQTMLVNATAIVPAVWESTVGRGVNMAINRFVKDPMAEQSGEAKYILKALAPAITRAKSNFQASMAAQHPMFDRDVNAMEVDWDKILGGGSHKMIGSISGRKGDLIRIPMRLLTATDDFNRTLLACCEVGTFAYRIAKAKGMKPGSPEMDKFIRVEVNTPGSFSYQLASKKASSAIYSNPLPGQKDPHTGKPVPVRDLGDVVGFVASKITDAVSKEHDSIFLKAVSAAFRISFFPFQRTPFNIIRKGIRHTLNPFSLFDIGLGIVQNNRGANPDGTTKWEWNAQGRNPELIERAGQQLQGAILMTLLVGAAAGEGDDDDMDKPFVITGSLPFLPSNMAERDARMRSGIGAYRVSFRRKDGSERFGFSYGRMEPVATLLSSTIDTIKSVKRSDRAGGTSYDAAASAMGGFASQAQDKTFMRGVGDLIGLVKNIVAEPDIKENRKALQFLAGRVAMVVPNIIKQPIREMDPQFRDRSTGFMEEMLYQAAPYGQKPAKVDPYGQVLHKPGTAASRPLDVADTGTDTVNPIDRMLVKWSDSGKWSKAADPSDRKPWFPAPIMNAEFKHSKTGQNVKMNGEQLAEFREKAGKRAMVLLKAGNLNTQNPTARDVEKVKEIISKSRSDIKKMLAFKFSR